MHFDARLAQGISRVQDLQRLGAGIRDRMRVRVSDVYQVSVAIFSSGLYERQPRDCFTGKGSAIFHKTITEEQENQAGFRKVM